MLVTHHVVQALVHLQQEVDISGDQFKADVSKLAGNFFLAILGVLGVIALIRKKVVEVLELIGLAILAGTFTYKADVFPSLAGAITRFFVK